MTRWHWTGQIASLLVGIEPLARAEEPVPIPPVSVPLPQPDQAPESPVRRDPTGSITLIETREHRGEAKDTAELLAGAPGLLLQDQGGLGQTKMLAIRGASSNGVLVFLDGIPLNGAGGSTDLSRIPSAIVERIEVLRGAAGSVYGSGGLGGAVNFVTRLTRRGTTFSAEATQGSFGTSLGQIAAASDITGGQGLVVLHGAHSTGDFPYAINDTPELQGNPSTVRTRENNQAAIGGGLIKFRRALSAVMVFDGLAEVMLESRGLAGTVVNPTLDAHETSQRIASSLRITRQLAGGAELSGRAFIRRDHLSLAGGYFAAGLDESEWVVGGEIASSAVVAGTHALTFAGQLQSQSLTEPTQVNPSWFQGGVLASDEILISAGKVSINPSLRLDRTGPYSGVSAKLGAMWSLPARLELHANVGSAHRAPSFVELYVADGRLLPNKDLHPERAWYADLSIAHRTTVSNVSLGGFYSLYDNLISYEYYPPLLARAYNFNSARVYGIEAEARGQPHQWLSALVGYTLLFSQNQRDDPRYYLKELPYRPRHKLYARLTGGPSVIRAHVDMNYQSEQFFNRTETLSLPARTLIHVGISSTVLSAPELAISVEVKNILDASAQDFDAYPLPGRAAYLTLRMSWDRSDKSSAVHGAVP